MTDAPIEIHGLVKRFGAVTALDGLDLKVEAGTVHGFLGPNGAGKSTAIRTMLGLYRPDAGRVRILGEDPEKNASSINRRLAHIPGEVALWPNLTGGQVLDALAGLRGARDEARERELLERFDLDPGKRVRTYSKGNRQKVCLVAALAAPVDLFLLDEPTSGLDPLMERVFTEVIAELAARGATVLLSSHILSEVQALCSRVTIIKDGRAVEDGELAALRALSLTSIRIGAEAGARDAIEKELRALVGEPDHEGGRILVQVDSELVPRVLAIAAANAVSDIRVEPASLEDLFLSHYAGDPMSAELPQPLRRREPRHRGRRRGGHQ